MKIFILCFALVMVSFVSTARAQGIEDNKHYHEFKKWTVAAQHKRPLPVVFDWCVGAYNKMIESGISPSTQVPEEVMSADIDFPKIEWKGTVKELNERLCSGGQKKLTGALSQNMRRIRPFSKLTSWVWSSTRKPESFTPTHLPVVNIRAMPSNSPPPEFGSSILEGRPPRLGSA